MDSPSIMADTFSHKRYFINNVDSYHGKLILDKVAKILEKNANASKQTSLKSVIGEDGEPPLTAAPEQPYEIIATCVSPDTKSVPNVTKVLSKQDYLPTVLTCGTVIWDISYDREELRVALEYMELLKVLLEANAPKDDADADAGGEAKKRYMILISTVMTWASTKPLDPETPDLPFIETDFRKRRPHPNYKMHYDCENEVVGIARNYKSQIGALVVAAGLTYGGREDVLFCWFQKAWENDRFLPIIGRGSNVIPLLNIKDLAEIVYNLIEEFPRKLYILAVEQNITKQREIVKALGKQVGSGMFQCIQPEDAFLLPDVDQRVYDLMTLNLVMEPTFIVETMGLQWASELPFQDNVVALMKEFRKERKLKPFKVIVYGPPIVGKTTLCKQLCETYGLMYISPDTIAQDLLDDLTWRMEHWEKGDTTALGGVTTEDDIGSVETDEDEDAAQETARTTLAMLRSGRALTDEEIISLLRQRILCREAQNRGWVLDGFPNALAQCTLLFEKGEDDEDDAEEVEDEEQFEEDVDLYSNVLKKILPGLVVSLEATDEYICEKAMRLPECQSRLDEELILKRLSEFRTTDARDVTPLNFFDELDIHPLVIQMKSQSDYAMKGPFKEVCIRMGTPCQYATLLARTEAIRKAEKEEKDTIRMKEEKAQKALEQRLQEERENKMEYWSELYALLREEEEAALAAAGEPMRNYLMNHIFPTLTPALLEVAKLRPTDPIDFLAEYLFKLNPTGKMLEPGFNLQAEMLLGRVKILDDALKGLDIKIDPLIPPNLDWKEDKVHVDPMDAL